MAPMTTWASNDDGTVSDEEEADYRQEEADYRRRAKDVGLVITRLHPRAGQRRRIYRR
jgi:2,4-dienoyl-CoA reductase-like NADH-dependent reductase (Old Yellow Enzyme family)